MKSAHVLVVATGLALASLLILQQSCKKDDVAVEPIGMTVNSVMKPIICWITVSGPLSWILVIRLIQPPFPEISPFHTKGALLK